MAWCDVVEPRTLRECRIALGKSQAAFAAMLGVSPESYRTWDSGRRATPPKMLARARALATHRDDHELLPLPVLALLIGVHAREKGAEMSSVLRPVRKRKKGRNGGPGREPQRTDGLLRRSRITFLNGITARCHQSQGRRLPPGHVF